MSPNRLVIGVGLFCTFVMHAAAAAQLTGQVVDAHTGQTLTNVTVRLGSESKSTTDAAGRFAFQGLQAGDYVLQVSAVGYRLVTEKVHVEADENTTCTLVISPDSMRRVDTVSVNSGAIFDPVEENAPGQFSIAGNDVINLSTVLASDPLRAVQSMPA